MKIDFMRWVDFWIGVPLCFIFSILNSLLRLIGIGRLKPGFKPQCILFIELSEMGSTILAYSAMKKAKETFKAEIYFLIFKKNAESVRLLNIIPEENILTIRSHSFSTLFLDTVSVFWKMRARRIDTAIDLELFSRFTSLLCFFSPARAVVGYHRYHMEGLYRGNFRTHRVLYNPYYHMSQNFMALVYSLIDGARDEPLLKRRINRSEIEHASVTSTDEEKETLRNRLQEINHDLTESIRLVLLNPGASELLPVREWPLEYYQKLAAEICSSELAAVVIIGVERDKSQAQAICDFVQDGRCIDFTGRTANLRELVTLYNISDLLVTNDSGPAHFAGLSNIRIIALFGPETPRLYAPLSDNCEALHADLACSPCVSAYNHRKTTCQNNECLQAITVEQVYEEVLRSLSG